jgi:flagellar biosynthesis chaperone FliJ
VNKQKKRGDGNGYWISLFVFFIFILVNIPAISALENIDGKLIGGQSATATKAGAYAKKATGMVGESFMDDYYAIQGWEKIPSQIGVQGIDGLYVQRDASGVIRKVLVSESKSGTSILGQTNNGPQMSHQWVQKKIQELAAKREKIFNQLQNTNISAQTSAQLKKELAALPSEKDLTAIKRFTERSEVYRRRLFHSEVSEGALKIRISDIGEIAGNVETKPIDGRARIEKGREYLDAKDVREVSLRGEAPLSGEKLRIYENYFKALEQEIEPYIGQPAANKTVEALRDQYKNRVISNTSEQYHFLKEEIDKHLEQAYIAAQTPTDRMLTKTRLLAFRLSNRIPKNVRVSANAAMVAGLFSAGHAWNAYTGSEGLLEAASAVGKDSSLAGVSMYASEALIQRVNNTTIISTVTKGALGVGIATFIFDETNHIYSFAQGNIDSDQFATETAKSCAKTLVSGSAAYGAVLIGASPGGPVVMAVSIGSYVIADLTITKYEEINARNAVTIKDVLWQLPVDIQKRATIFEIEEVTGETILDPASIIGHETILDPASNGHESVLDTAPQGNQSTVLSSGYPGED